MILPGQTIGVLGGGPISRMLAQAAQTLGYRVNVFDSPAPEAGAAGGRESGRHGEGRALKEFARQVDVITCASENAAFDALGSVGVLVPMQPRAEVMEICQNRQREKAWLRSNGFPHVRYAEALDGDIVSVIGQVGRPCVVKTADFDHDGRGQMKITTDADLERAAAIYRGRRCILERWIDFSCEVSVIVARSAAGEMRAFPLAENIHTRQVLDVSIAPARVSPAIAREAVQIGVAMAEKIGLVGLLASEMFITPGGEVLVNELAPRPHNSGHWTIEGCETSQFEQHVRAVCGWSLGAVTVREPTVMVNLLGDLWYSQKDDSAGGRPSRVPNWDVILSTPGAKLHVYAETTPRIGRKAGHFTVRDPNIEAALARAKELKERL